MKTIPLTRIAGLKIILVSLALQGAGATIPIAAGNTWVYRYHWRLSSFLSNFGTKDGLFIMSINSVSKQGDSVFFGLVTIDSGSNINPTGKYTYDDHDTNSYLVTNNTLFVKDTTGLWKLSTGPIASLVSYVIRPDTTYQISDSTLVTVYRRHTDSAAVISNGQDTGVLYTTIKDSTIRDCWNPDWLTSHYNDTTRWLENIGPIYQIFAYCHYSPVMLDANISLITRYSLDSFNGKAIVITPINSGAKGSLHATKPPVLPRRCSKTVWLDGEARTNAGSHRYSNLTGRRIDHPRGAQFLIYR